MKKILVILLISIILFTNNTKKDDLIRIRIIANSNSEYDQQIKEKVSSDVRKKLYTILKNENNIDSAREKIRNNVDNIEKIIKKDLTNEEYSYSINYGLNYFPKKEYKGKIYKEGNYESLLITLGKGEGNNWWCILFPPICLIEADEQEEVEYNFFFKDLINKIFK